MNTQTLIKQRIADAFADDPRFVLLDDTEWANTGTFRTVRRDTLEAVARLPYEFQSGHCTFGPNLRPIARYDWGRDPDMLEVINTVVLHLRGEL